MSSKLGVVYERFRAPWILLAAIDDEHDELLTTCLRSQKFGMFAVNLAIWDSWCAYYLLLPFLVRSSINVELSTNRFHGCARQLSSLRNLNSFRVLGELNRTFIFFPANSCETGTLYWTDHEFSLSISYRLRDHLWLVSFLFSAFPSRHATCVPYQVQKSFAQ
jgi:hypothetical protein